MLAWHAPGARENRQHTPVTTTFRELGVIPEIADALERVGIVTPFAIQEMTLSVGLMGTGFGTVDLLMVAPKGVSHVAAVGQGSVLLLGVSAFFIKSSAQTDLLRHQEVACLD